MNVATREFLVPAEIIESLELLMYGAIGMTTIALSAASARELTLSQWRALVVLGRNRAVRVGEISAAVGMSLPSTSRMIRRLEQRGLVATARDESDRRATLVSVTRAGRNLRDDVVRRRRTLMEAALAARTPTLPRDLSDGLDAIAKAFAEYE
jgi:DNA-binding MarR family transcriptional regulator